jgi:type IV pilus assembly protein PilO
MGLIPATKRDQYLALSAIGSIALAVLYYMYVWDPKRIELDATQAHVDSVVVLNQRAKSELAQGKTQELKAEADRLTADLEVMRRLVPTGNEVPALLEQVSTAARRVGLDISDVQPLPLLQGDQYDAYKYRLSLRGDYHQIAVLLQNIGSLQRIVAPINLTLAPTGGGPARKNVRTQQLEARFEIQTYVARNLPTAAAKTIRAGAAPTAPGERE